MTTVNIKKGQEGPSYDPYAYEEFHIKRPDRDLVIVHVGLGVSIDGLCFKGVDESFTSYFEKMVGITWSAFGRAAERLDSPPRRCPVCNTKSSSGRHCDGYPGETILICSKCDEILFAWFNESAII
jgi:hypothetical protein